MPGSRTIAAFVAGLFLAMVCSGQAKNANEPPQIIDITKSTGIHFNHLSSPESKYILESMSGGVAVLDYDGDGWPDIYFTNAPSIAMFQSGAKAKSALYRNNHDGTFTDVTDKAGVGFPCWAMGAAVGDFDNDGWPDLAVSCFGGVVLYRNNHDGTFSDVTKKSGLGQDIGWATGVSFGDYDGDGFVDLFVPHYVDFDLKNLPVFGKDKTCTYHDVAVQCGPRGLKGFRDSLYHNNGDGTFTDVSKAAHVDDAAGYFGMQSVWSDFDGDGKLDLFVANDGEPNYLYHNEGGGHFKDIATDAGVALSEDGGEQANMGVAIGDYNHTGRQSVAITHFSEDYTILYRNDGALNFTDVAHSAHIAQATAPYVGWGDAFFDSDNRGQLDFIMVNGHVYPQVDDARLGMTYREPKLFFWNDGDGNFRESSARTGKALTVPDVSRGLAVADLFNTGSLDVVIENLTGPPLVLAVKSRPANHWISFELEGTRSNRLALNAKVYVKVDGKEQMAEVLSGASYLSQSDLRLHFGLGAASKVDEVKVAWPDGTTQITKNLVSNRFYRWREGSDPSVDARIHSPK